MVITLEYSGVETVMVPVLEGIPVKRLKYNSPEVLLTPFKVTFVMLAGEEMVVYVSLPEAFKLPGYAVPVKMTIAPDSKWTP